MSPVLGVIVLALMMTLIARVAIAQPSPFTITPGMGHDLFSETFMLDDSTSVSPDSLARIKKTQADLQETYASLGLGADTRNWRFDNTVYATSKAWRDIANGHGRWSSCRWRTDVDGRLEWKGRSRNDTSAAAYTYARISATPQWRWNEKWSAIFSGDWEMTDYLRNTSYTYGYNRLRAQSGVGYLGSRMESFEARVGVSHRTVPDSLPMSYTEDFVRLNAYGWQFGRWRLEGDCSYAVRNFRGSGNVNDYARWSASTGVDYDWSTHWRTTVEASWQYWNYRQPDLLNFNLHDIRTEWSTRYAPDEVWEVGGAVELRLERATQDSLASNDYSQWAIGPRLVWNSGRAIWTELSPRVGHRNYAAASAVYDSYSFWDLLWQTDILGPAGATASATLTYLSERHNDPSRNASYLYVSAALRFPIHL